MTTLPGSDLSVDLQAGERVLSSVPADGYFASQHAASAPKPHVVITGRRFIVLTRRGMMKQRLDEVASWPLSSFTERINTSEGSALGSFMHVLTLFANDGETVSTGFTSQRACDEFKHEVVDALGPILG
ncbi:hypothetical protein [Blastococcus sp. CT_GayMR16]|uniref:hypothetical protein n=1 Tax=Blastococcus sp. CT_GayMR16 TaxID=2559607 RepID=UPI001073FEB9|nr:hypothetical protein [Blastococcus sp. CT_GayMR16]TFV89804.1 hypothetical protein E4P38_04895 [Blastococcus sp. CT_GayMR16]